VLGGNTPNPDGKGKGWEVTRATQMVKVRVKGQKMDHKSIPMQNSTLSL